MSIVPAMPSDLESAMQTVAACVQALCSLGIDQWDAEYPDQAVIQAAIDTGTLFIVRESASIAALAGMDLRQPAEYRGCAWRYPEPSLVVHHLCVHPLHWRRGLAGRLMAFAESLALQQSFSSVRLDAYPLNHAAISLYRSRGYSESGDVVFPRKGLRFTCFEKAIAARDS